MKKLLSLLSVITISGSAMPNVIAASPMPTPAVRQDSFSKFVTAIGILEKDSSNPTVKAGSIWIGTKNGLYFKYTNDVNEGKIYSIGGINEQVNHISVDNSEGAYLLTISGKLYYCGSGPQDWSANNINNVPRYRNTK